MVRTWRWLPGHGGLLDRMRGARPGAALRLALCWQACVDPQTAPFSVRTGRWDIDLDLVELNDRFEVVRCRGQELRALANARDGPCEAAVIDDAALSGIERAHGARIRALGRVR